MKTIRLTLGASVVVFATSMAGCDGAPAASSTAAPEDKKSVEATPIPASKPPPSTTPPPPPRIGPDSLPPRVEALANSGSPPMQKFIAEARAATGSEAAATWVKAAELAEKAKEFASALDLYQLAQQAAPKYCAGYSGARKLVTELGKTQVALLLITSEIQCTGADTAALRKEGERLKELLVVDEHAHGAKKGAANAATKPPR